MKRLLLAPLFLSLLSPAAYASEKDFKVRDTCARYYSGQLTSQQAIKRLNLKEIRKGTDWIILANYCSAYLGIEITNGSGEMIRGE
tara:strand:+ start:403 stop:660 length:258 start_codon:yes stop_codon:yes gene_type:complete